MHPNDVKVDNRGVEEEEYNSADDQDYHPNEHDRDASSSDESGDSDGLAAGNKFHDGGEGGLVKTRAQRRTETQERKPLVQASGASVDVDSLWAQMQTDLSKPSTVPAATPERKSSIEHDATSSQRSADADTVVIKRTFEFAGQTMEEERSVEASSAEAKLYQEQLANLAKPSTAQQSKPTTSGPVRRPIKRKSMFATNNGASAAKGPKLNTLQKSKLDWAAHVDKEGIADELQEHQRAKDSYTGRMDFLNRMDEKREGQQTPH